MKTTPPIKILLSDRVHRLVNDDATSQGVDPSQICGKIIANYYETRVASKTDEASVHPVDGATVLRQPVPAFQVEEAFSGYPPESLRLAQAFIDAAAKLVAVQVQRRSRSITFLPRFVRIDYLLSGRAPVPGLVASFYGAREQFDDPRDLLKAGAKSYVTARITSTAELEYCRQFIARAYENRFGSPQPSK